MHALDRASASAVPPVARNLLIRAERSAYDTHTREAVIDAATDEVSLTAGLRGLDELVTDATGDQVLLDRSRTLGGLIGLARSLRLALPERITPDLVEVRNDTLPGGRTVTPAEAWSAVRLARQLVDEYEPLDEHCMEPDPVLVDDDAAE